MRLALSLARRAQGRVEPNPMVGCVLVREGRIIGQGYHRRWGAAHAEVEALRAARDSARGCDVYVTLEPCSHVGKTAPCADALIRAGVGRVFAPMPDPGRHVRGRGFARLRRAGIVVEAGLCVEEARRLSAPYLKLVAQRRPWVILKWAQSIDGRLATRQRREIAISSARSRRLVHRWRGLVDAVLVGIETVRADDPLLTARLVRPRRVAARIVLDTNLRLAPTCRLVRSAQHAPLLVVCSSAARKRHERKAARLARAGAELLALPARKDHVQLPALLDELGRRRFTNLLVEGGGQVLGAFHDAGLADEARVFVSPLLIGGRDAPAALDGRGPADAPPRLAPSSYRVRRVGDDLLYEIRLAQQEGHASNGVPHL